MNEFLQQQLLTQLLQHKCFQVQCFQQAQQQISEHLHHKSEQSTMTRGPAIFPNKLQHQEKTRADKYWK